MRQHRLIVALSIVVLLTFTLTISLPAEDNEQATCDAILEQLSQKHTEELREYISFLDYTLDKAHLSGKEIDRIISKLLEIQDSDPYEKEVDSKGGKRTLHPNRHVSHQCIFRFRFQKIANDIRALPMEERVAELVKGMVDPPKLGYQTTGSFGRELTKAGKEAVPFIIRHKPEQPSYRRQIVEVLAEIGDASGVPYIIEVLNIDDENFRFARPDAAIALAKCTLLSRINPTDSK